MKGDQRAVEEDFRVREYEGKIHFSSLSDHVGPFSAGLPILCYHKVGPRPRGVKWRSLYVAPKLFARQMAELASAGFCTTNLSAPRPSSGNSQQRFVITFDDGYTNVLTHAAPVLARHQFTAIQFIVAGAIGGTNHWDVSAGGEVPEALMDEAQIRTWLAAGHEIGSHSVTHPRMTTLSRDAQREELRASKQRLEDLFGVPVKHFCFPYGDTNAELQEIVRECGYETACTQVGGVNLATTDRFALRRFECRYPKRSLRAVLQRWWRRLG